MSQINERIDSSRREASGGAHHRPSNYSCWGCVVPRLEPAIHVGGAHTSVKHGREGARASGAEKWVLAPAVLSWLRRVPAGAAVHTGNSGHAPGL